MANENQTQTKPQSLNERILEKATKQIEKGVVDRVDQKLQLGQNPQSIIGDLLKSMGQGPSQQNVLKQITDLASTQVGTGERVGLLTSLTKGQGLSRPEATEALGFERALKTIGLQQDIAGQQAEAPGRAVDLLNDLLKLSKEARSPALFNKISSSLGGPTITKEQLRDGKVLRDPFTGELTVAGEVEKQRQITRATQQEQLIIKREGEKVKIQTNFNTTVGQFKQLISQLKGGAAEGGAGGLLQGFYGNLGSALKIPGLGRTAAIPGQIRETSLVLNRILTNQNRVIKGVVQMITQTLPTSKDPPDFIAPKVEQSLRNAFRITKAFEKAGLSSDVLNKMTQIQLDTLDVQGLVSAISLTPEEQAEIDSVVTDVLAAPPSQPRTLGKAKQPGLSKEEQSIRNLSDAQLRAIVEGR